MRNFISWCIVSYYTLLIRISAYFYARKSEYPVSIRFALFGNWDLWSPRTGICSSLAEKNRKWEEHFKAHNNT